MIITASLLGICLLGGSCTAAPNFDKHLNSIIKPYRFSIPKWEWHEALPYIRKCTMCEHLINNGGIPACVENCPGNNDGPALVFGERNSLIYEAEKRIHEKKELYFPHVFGRDEVGGTGVLYIMNKNLSPAEAGFPEGLGKRSIPDYSKKPQSTVPYWVGGLGAMFTGLHWIIKRRDKLMTEDKPEEGGG